jgi:hypothetical protein
VVAADDLFQRVADAAQEIGIGIEDVAGQVEFDLGLRAVDGRELACRLIALALGGTDVAGVFDDLDGWPSVSRMGL